MTMRIFVGPDIERSVIGMRMFNVVIASGLLALATLVASPVVRRALFVSWAIALAPVGLYFIASVNPSSWAIAAGGTLWVFAATLAQERTLKSRRSQVALAGAVIAASLAILARSDQVATVLITLVAVAILFNRRWLSWRTLAVTTAGLLAGSIFAYVFSVGTYVRSRVLVIPRGNADFDQPNPFIRMLTELPAYFAGHFGSQPAWLPLGEGEYLGVDGWVNRAFVYGLGSHDISMPSLVGVFTLVAAGITFSLGLMSVTARKTIAVTFIMVSSVGFITIQRSLANWASPGEGNFFWYMTPRYTFPLFILGFGILLLVEPASRRLVPRTHLLVLTTLLTSSTTVALLAVITRYSQGEGAAWMTLQWPDGWWWNSGPSPHVLVAINIVASLLFYSRMLSLGETETLLDNGQPRYEKNQRNY